MGFVLKGKVEQYRRLLNKRAFDEILMPKVDAELGRVADIAVSVALPRSDVPGHSSLTKAMRQGGPVLVDSGELKKAIVKRRIKRGEWWVGVPKASSKFRLAKLVNDGTTITVTESMRHMFFSLWLACQGKLAEDKLGPTARALFKKWRGWLPIKAGTTQIKIPARRFMLMTFQDDRVRIPYRDAVLKAVRSTIRKLAR